MKFVKKIKEVLVPVLGIYSSHKAQMYDVPLDVAIWDAMTPEVRGESFRDAANLWSLSHDQGLPDHIVIRWRSDGIMQSLPRIFPQTASELLTMGWAK